MAISANTCYGDVNNAAKELFADVPPSFDDLCKQLERICPAFVVSACVGQGEDEVPLETYRFGNRATCLGLVTASKAVILRALKGDQTTTPTEDPDKEDGTKEG